MDIFKEKQSKSEDIKRKRQEHDENISIEFLAETLKTKIVKNGGEFSETISITPEGKLELMDSEGKLKSLFVHFAIEGPEELFKIAEVVQDKFPELKFHFERDHEGHWIKYTINMLSSPENNFFELDKMQEAFNEAAERLESALDYDEVMSLWANDIGRDSEKISTFLNKNKKRLSPEAIFFLNAAIYLRMVREKHREARS